MHIRVHVFACMYVCIYVYTYNELCIYRMMRTHTCKYEFRCTCTFAPCACAYSMQYVPKREIDIDESTSFLVWYCIILKRIIYKFTLYGFELFEEILRACEGKYDVLHIIIYYFWNFKNTNQFLLTCPGC